MINLYNNHNNKKLKFKVDITGVDASEVKPRLIIETEDKNYMVKGKIENKECNFVIPMLEGLIQGEKGKVYYEVIVSNEQYSKLWEEDFETISKTEIKVVESNYEEQEEAVVAPKISVVSLSSVEEEELVNESIEEEKVEEKTQEKEEIKIDKEVIIEEDKEEEISENTERVEDMEGNFLNFNDFLSKNTKGE